MKRITFEIDDYVHCEGQVGKCEITDEIHDREGNLLYAIRNTETNEVDCHYPEALMDWDEWLKAEHKFDRGTIVKYSVGDFNLTGKIIGHDRDMDGNKLYYIDGPMIDEEYPMAFNEDELVLAEPQQDASDLISPGLQFPSFKSYGLTREQVWEVTKLYVEAMIRLYEELAQEALNDNNWSFAKEYFDEATILLKFKMIEDKLYHRFVYS